MENPDELLLSSSFECALALTSFRVRIGLGKGSTSKIEISIRVGAPTQPSGSQQGGRRYRFVENALIGLVSFGIGEKGFPAQKTQTKTQLEVTSL